MKKLIIYVVLLFIFTSCHSYRMLDGKSRTVFFTPDSSVFNDTSFHYQFISYHDVMSIRGNISPNVVQLMRNETATTIIHEPTIFNDYDNFLVYPGEHIRIKKGELNDYTFFKVNGSNRRNRELLFYSNFRKIDHYPNFPNIQNASLDTILSLERKLKIEIPIDAFASRIRFDSLIKANHVSRKFMKESRNYLKNRYEVGLIPFYKQYEDTLRAHNLYKEKFKQLIPLFNYITKREEFGNTAISFGELCDVVLPYKIYKIKSESEFKSSFDTVVNNFNAIARDYLLSRLLYYANENRIKIDSEYLEKYSTICNNKTYKNLIAGTIFKQQAYDKAIAIGNNSIVSVNGEKTSRLEDILAKHKGDLIFIDFWSSSCGPCREEVPYFKKIIKEYQDDKIVFLNVSFDKDTQLWRKAVFTNYTETNNNYKLINAEKSSFVQQYNIKYVPRYILIDKEGKIIDADAPRPSDPKLIELLKKYL